MWRFRVVAGECIYEIIVVSGKGKWLLVAQLWEYVRNENKLLSVLSK